MYTVMYCQGVRYSFVYSPQAEPENSVVLEILSPEEVYQDLTTPVEREHLWHIISVDKTPSRWGFVVFLEGFLQSFAAY